jgi:excisionase family DNA binding protein
MLRDSNYFDINSFAMSNTKDHPREVIETMPAGAISSTVHLGRVRITRDEGPDLLSVTQFADEANITAQAVRKMIAEDRLEAHKIGEQYVIYRDKLNEYLANR